MAAKQAELQEALASLEALNKRREALAEHVARLGQLSTQAKVRGAVPVAAPGLPVAAGGCLEWPAADPKTS